MDRKANGKVKPYALKSFFALQQCFKTYTMFILSLSEMKEQ